LRELVRETWFKWAGIIKQAKLTEFERLEAVRMMLGVLILQKGKCSLTQDELREAAEDALKWTRWDENTVLWRACGISPNTRAGSRQSLPELDLRRRPSSTTLWFIRPPSRATWLFTPVLSIAC
jgi:hypothetical protein